MTPDLKILTGVAWFTGALVAVNFVDTRPVVTGVALTVVNVDFTVHSWKKKIQKRKKKSSQ